MRVAIYGRKFNDSAIQHVQQLIDSFLAHEVENTKYAAFHAYLIPRIQLPDSVKLFTQHQDLVNQVDCLVSIGGDGTMLDTLTLVRDSGIPVIGINMGRLGFLASIAKTEIATAVDSLVKGHFTIDKRSLIKLESNIELFNELAVYFSDNLFNMFKLLDNSWRNLIINELQDHIGKNKNSKEITNRNIYIGTEIEFVWYDDIVEEENTEFDGIDTSEV
jgi:NAD kinase